jgi:hypothetical protein
MCLVSEKEDLFLGKKMLNLQKFSHPEPSDFSEHLAHQLCSSK